jgi:hypothetical protein
MVTFQKGTNILPKRIQAYARNYFPAASWKVGDKVRSRTWDYAVSDEKKPEPIVSKYIGYVREVVQIGESLDVWVYWPAMKRCTAHSIDLIPA